MPGVLSQNYIIRKGAKPEIPPRRSFYPAQRPARQARGGVASGWYH